MGKKKGGKKGKKKTDEAPIETTRQIVRERERCMCPRLGDATVRHQRAEKILRDCVQYKITRFATKETTVLDLSRANLPFIPKEMTDLDTVARKRLEEVDLSRNQLFGSEHVFTSLGQCDHLTKLDLSHNFLNGPLSLTIAKFGTLERLCLDDNQLTSLPDPLGAVLPAMRHFSAARNALTRLPATLSDWRHLVSFSARNNKLTMLNQVDFSNWAHIELVFLGTNELTDIPETLCQPSLLELDLRSNKITDVPLALAKCTQLKRLHLGDNKFVTIPPEILGNLPDLEELHLYKNKIDTLPDDIGKLTKCERMTLSSTNLKTLPETIAACESLEELYLNNCTKLSSLPPGSGSLVKLKELQAKKCPALKALPSTAVAWSNLKELDLRAAKKQVCKLQPELLTALGKCNIRGGVQKGGKKK